MYFCKIRCNKYLSAITPIRGLFGTNWLRYRRTLGLLAFYYVLMHFPAYLLLDQVLNLAAIFADITRRPFITIGMAALIMLIPLALTSNNWAIRRLSTRWNMLHRLAYVITAAGALHFAMSVKVVGPEQMLYLGLVTVLLAWRAVRKPYLRHKPPSANAPIRRQPHGKYGRVIVTRRLLFLRPRSAYEASAPTATLSPNCAAGIPPSPA